MTTPSSIDRASTERHAQVLVSINGVSLGVFDKREGGNTTATNEKHTPGSAPSARVALGGPRDTSDVTVTRAFVASRDHDLIKRYRNLTGLADMVVTESPLDKDGRVLGDKSEQWTGVLQDIGRPNYDANSGAVAMFEIVMTCDGDVT